MNHRESPEVESQAPDAEAAPQPPRTKLFAAIVLTVTAMFGAGAVFGGLWLTGQWDGPSTDDPAESVDGFLAALLSHHDAEDATTYTCTSQSGDLGKIVEQLDDAKDAAQFSWDKVTTIDKSGESAAVTAKITHDLTGDTATWTFALVTGDPDDAWRVCGIYPESEAAQ